MPLTEEQWIDIEWAIEDLTDRATDYKTYRDYYDGNHSAVLSTDEYHNAFERVFAEFRDNLCPRVVDGKVDRLQITAFGSDQDAENVKQKAQEVWDRNLLQRRQGEVHLEALKMGDAFIMVWPDETDMFPIWYPQRAEQIAVRWNEERPGQIEMAAKCWQTRVVKDGKATKVWYLTLYYEDRIEKYWVDRKDPVLPKEKMVWSMREVEGEPWPLPHDMGRVPIWVFNNNGSIGGYGKSELKDAVPIQNALNKANLDLLAGMEFAALPQRWATGITVEIDPVTKKPVKPWEPGADRILATGNPAARFGDFAAADIEKLLKAVEDRRMEMARVGVVPMHWLNMGGSIPSGVALRIIEAPTVALVKDRQESFGMVWEDLMEWSVMRLGVSDPHLPPNWADPVQVDPVEAAETGKIKKELGVPDEQVWRELGYDEEQIEEFTQAKLDRQAEAMAQFGGFGPNVDIGPFGASDNPTAIN